MEIKPYLYQGLGTVVLATMVNSLGAWGTRLVRRVPVTLSGALEAGITAGMSATGGVIILRNTPLEASIQGYFPESRFNFGMFFLMMGTFFSSFTHSRIVQRPISMLGGIGYSAIGAASCNVVALYVLSRKKKP